MHAGSPAFVGRLPAPYSGSRDGRTLSMGMGTLCREVGELRHQSVEMPDGLRAIAQRAIRLAMTISGDEGCQRLLEFAGELAARAAELEVVEVKPPSD
jgi:hypothetical protein